MIDCTVCFDIGKKNTHVKSILVLIIAYPVQTPYKREAITIYVILKHTVLHITRILGIYLRLFVFDRCAVMETYYIYRFYNITMNRIH